MSKFPSLQSQFSRLCKHPLIDLLKMFVSPKPPNPPESDAVAEFLKMCSVPSIDKQQLAAVSTLVSQNTKQIEKLLQPVANSFVFDELVLKLYVSNFNGTYDLVPLCCALAFMACENPANFENSVPVLLEACERLTPAIAPEVKTYCLVQVVARFMKATGKCPELSVVQSVFQECDPNSFDVLVEVLSIADDYQIREYAISVLWKSIENDPDSFFECNFGEIVKFLNEDLAKLDFAALKFLNLMMRVKIDATIMSTICCFPRIILDVLKEDFVIPDGDSKNVVKCEKCYDYTFDFEIDDTFPDGLCPLPSTKFDELCDIKTVVPSSYIGMSDHIANLWSDWAVMCKDLFLESFAKLLSEECSDKTSILFVLLLVKLGGSTTPSVVSIVRNSRIFDGSVSIMFDVDEASRIILPLRMYFLDYLLQDRSTLPELFTELESDPILFAELLCRVHLKLRLTDPNVFLTCVNQISRTISNLWRLYQETRDSEDISHIQVARSTLFSILSGILEDKTISIAYFSNWSFVCCYLARVLENSLRRHILSTFARFLGYYTKGVPITLSLQLISGVFDVCRTTKQDVEALTLDMLQVITEAAIIKQTLAGELHVLMGYVTGYLVARPSFAFLSQTLRFISSLPAEKFEFSLPQIQQLSAAVRMIECDDPSQDTISSILGTMGMSKFINANLNSMFLIVDPSPILLLFSIVRSKDRLKEHLELMINLCKYSTSNCIQCHRGELDLLLLEMIGKSDKEFRFRGCTFDNLIDEQLVVQFIIPLLSSIASVVSSPMVAAKAVLLASPDDKQTFSEDSVKLFKMVSSIVCTNAKAKWRAIPLSMKGPLFVSDPIPRSLIEKGMTVRIWLRVDCALAQSKNIKQEILGIKYDDHHKITIEVNGDTIVCRIFSPNEVRTAMLSNSVPPCEWFMGTVVFERACDENPKDLSFCFYLNAMQGDRYCVDYPDPPGSTFKVFVGAPIDNKFENDFPCYITSAYVYGGAMTQDIITALYGTDCSVSSTMPICCGYPCDSSHVVQLNKGTDPDYLCSLTESLCKADVFSIVILLFGYIDTMPNLFLEMLLDITERIVDVGSLETLEYDVFGVIGHLLRRAQSSRLTYALYLRFFALLEKCSDTLAVSLTNNILMNVGLWASSENTQLIRILGHWNSSLSQLWEHNIPQTDFGLLLSLTRMYLWYTPVERNIINMRPYQSMERDPALEIEHVRQMFDKFMITMSKGRLSESDSLCLLYHASVCMDNLQVLNFLTMFKEIGSRDPDVVKYLLFFFRPRAEDLFITALKTLYHVAEGELVNCIDAVVASIGIKCCTSKLFRLCTELIEECPLVYPIMIRLALSLGTDAKVKAAVALKLIKSKDFKLIQENQLWSLWPVILGCHLPRAQLREVIFFVCSVLLDDFQVDRLRFVLGILDVLKVSCLPYITEFESELLTVIVNLNVMSEATVRNKLFRFCLKSVLLHRVNGNVLPMLASLYAESPYVETHDENIHESMSSHSSMSPLVADESSKSNFLFQTTKPKRSDRREHRNIADMFSARPRSGTSTVMRKRISSSFSQSQLFSDTPDICELLESNADVIAVMKKHGDEIKYTFGVMFPTSSDVSQSLIDITLELSDSLTLSEKYCVICTYLKDIKRNLRIPPSKELDESMTAYYKKASAKWESFCVSVKKCIYRHCFDVEATLETVLRKMRCENIAANETVSKCILSENQTKDMSIHQSKRILKSVAHSWRDIKFQFRRSFRCTPWFAQVKIKRDVDFNSKFVELSCRSDSICDCQVVHISREVHTKFRILKDRIILDGYASIDPSEIWCILKRLRIQKKTCLEFFLLDGRSYLVDFAPKLASSVIKDLKSLKMENCAYFPKCGFRKMFKQHGKTAEWVEGKISNFEYLMHLNMFASRSFHDACLYPIFPWTLSKYDSPTLDLMDETNFRDFKYPMFAQTENQRHKLTQKMDFSEPVTSSNAMSFIAPSSPPIVGHWLLRMRPFTDLHMEFEDGKFGFSARLFRSIELAYRQAMESGSSWELTPEFYCCPEFLYNMNDEKIGADINHVEPPSWASTNYEFIYKHRKALESDYVSEHLHEWIDLIFGVASRGQNAIDVFNVLSPLLYPDVWKNPSVELSDPNLIVTTLQKSGQMPPQIFDAPHPTRAKSSTPVAVLLQDAFGKSSVVTSVVKGDTKALKFLSLFADGTFATHVVKNGSSVESKSIDPRIDVTKFVVAHASGISILSDTFYSIVNFKGACKTHDIALNVAFASTDGVNVAYCTRDGDIWFMKGANIETQRRVCGVYYEKPASMATSTDFDILAIGTFNGSILFYSLSSHVFRFKATISEEMVHRILVTQGWGFVLAYTGKRLHLFSVNGALLKSIDIVTPITAWCTWKSRKGFDYLALADQKGVLYVMEVFEMTLGKPVHLCGGKAVSLCYLAETSQIAVVTCEGKYSLIPYSHDC